MMLRGTDLCAFCSRAVGGTRFSLWSYGSSLAFHASLSPVTLLTPHTCSGKLRNRKFDSERGLRHLLLP